MHGIPESTPTVDMRCPRAMTKVALQECVGQNYRHTNGTSTASTNDHGSTCMYAQGSTCMYKQTRRMTRKDARGITYMGAQEARARMFLLRARALKEAQACTDISTESTGVHRGKNYPR